VKRVGLLAGALALGLVAALATWPRPAADPEPEAAPTATAAGGAPGIAVVARVEGAASGRIAFALFRGAASFGGAGDPLRKAFVALEPDGAATWEITDLRAGDYAIKAFHDVNGNGRLDRGAFGIPTEPYGFSRNARGRLGPPGYDDARFRFGTGDLRLEIRLE
jgi:uncharacterized protein (DUF2141 family)